MYTPHKILVSRMEGNYAWFIKRQILLYKSQNLWTSLLERNPKTRMHLKKKSQPHWLQASIRPKSKCAMWNVGKYVGKRKILEIDKTWSRRQIVRISWICLWPSISYFSFFFKKTFVKQILVWNCLSMNMEKCCYESNRQTIGRIKGQGHPKQRSGKDGESQSLRILNVSVIF